MIFQQQDLTVSFWGWGQLSEMAVAWFALGGEIKGSL